MGGTVDGDDCTVGSRTIKAIANPIGIDFEDFCAAGSSPEADQTRRQMRASLQDRRLIVGVDRLDYRKGLEERLLGYERFLQDHTGYHSNVVIVQIAPPSREDVEDRQSKRLHSSHSSAT